MSKHYASKQVILIRTDLKNVQGHKVKSSKMGVQIAHASMAWIGTRLRKLSPAGVKEPNPGVAWRDYILRLNEAEAEWLVNHSFAKILLAVDSEEELRSLVEKAKAANLETEIITDAGHTEFGGVPTVTSAGIGPAWSEEIDKITGHLKSY